jgi:hypothetical protein
LCTTCISTWNQWSNSSFVCAFYFAIAYCSVLDVFYILLVCCTWIYRTRIKMKWNEIPRQKDRSSSIALTTYIGILQEAAQQATPTPKPQTRRINIPSEIKELITEKRRAKKVWQQSHAPSDRTAYDRTTNKLRAAIRKSGEQTLQNYLRSPNHYDNSIWKLVNATNKTTAPVPPLRVQTQDHSELWARSDKEKAELFAAHLSKDF